MEVMASLDSANYKGLLVLYWVRGIVEGDSQRGGALVRRRGQRGGAGRGRGLKVRLSW